MTGWLSKREKGFTLMELLIAVAIVAILAGVGIPVYTKLRSSAKHTEASANLDGIRTAEEAYKMTNGTYIDCAASPRDVSDLATAGNQTVTWQDRGTGFTAIGFQPNSGVRFVYQVTGATSTTYTAGAIGDTDADGNQVLFIATPSRGPHLVDGTDITDAGGTLSIFGLSITDASNYQND